MNVFFCLMMGRVVVCYKDNHNIFKRFIDEWKNNKFYFRNNLIISEIGNRGKTSLKKPVISLIFVRGINAKTIITTTIQTKKYNVTLSIF